MGTQVVVSIPAGSHLGCPSPLPRGARLPRRVGTARTTVATDGGDAPAMCAERMSFDYGRSSFDRGCAMAYDDRSSRSSEGSMKRNLSRLDSWVAKAPAPTCRRRRTETKSAEDRPAAPPPLGPLRSAVPGAPFPERDLPAADESGWGHYAFSTPSFPDDHEPATPSDVAPPAFGRRADA